MKDKFILLIEDNINDELLTLRALKNNGISNPIEVARDGEEALDFFAARGRFKGRDVDQLPQVVLLDLKLPKLDGLEVLKSLRSEARTKILPVVVLTTSDTDHDIVSAYQLGANSFVRKPIDFKEFTSSVANLGLYWLILNKVI